MNFINKIFQYITMEEIKLIDSHSHPFLVNEKLKNHPAKNDPINFKFNSNQQCVPFITNKQYTPILDKIVNITAFLDDFENLHFLNDANVIHAFGFHPHTASEYISNKEKCTKLLNINLPHTKAVGECGLDYGKYDSFNKEHQFECFGDQLQFAKTYNKPIVIHIRDQIGKDDAYIDTYNLIKQILPLDWKIHFHCFSGTADIAKLYLETFPNCIFGFTGNITFKKADPNTHDVIKMLPNNKIVLETDSPFMTPEPHRSKTCTSAHVSLVLEKICSLRQVDVKELGNIIYDTTVSFYLS